MVQRQKANTAVGRRRVVCLIGGSVVSVICFCRVMGARDVRFEVDPTGRTVLALGAHVSHAAAATAAIAVYSVRGRLGGAVRRLPVFAQRLCRRRAKLAPFARVEKALELHAAAARGATVARWFEVPVQGSEVAGQLGVGTSCEGAVLAGQEESIPALLQVE